MVNILVIITHIDQFATGLVCFPMEVKDVFLVRKKMKLGYNNGKNLEPCVPSDFKLYHSSGASSE